VAPCDNCESSLHNHGERRLPYKVEHHLGLLQVLVMSLTEPNSSLQLGKNLEIGNLTPIHGFLNWENTLIKIDHHRDFRGFQFSKCRTSGNFRQFGRCPFRRSRPAANPSPPGRDFSNLLAVNPESLSAKDI